MRLPSLAVLALTALFPLQSVAGSITVKPGETLSDIAARYNISLTKLMRMNDISNPDHVEIGSRLTVPGSNVQAGSGRHQVASGETLSGIASQYNVSPRDLMALNGLADADHVELGQTLKLPSSAVQPTKRPKAAPITVVTGASEHTVAKGQTLTQIARAYKIPVTSLISINQLVDPNKVEIGTRLYLKAPASATSAPVEPAQTTASAPAAQTKPKADVKAVVKAEPTSEPKATPKTKASSGSSVTVIAKKADWRSYGPLQIDWANWLSMDGAHVAPTLNAQGQALYVAINCSAGKMNATGADGAWKSWSAPQSGFEKDLMKDRCQAKA
ncbi:LysM peptidoglycan-binding domain-containing protein [Synechococcus sp. CC9616]|uniref:muramidase family protein n=1 Tax=Synechococcus sp. CC9616 TaxID=110663 RepID=UPI00048BFE0D|nr:LysM peptidoglycan-binding domain-containing protein [Synechococcus sp. CC9616]